MMLRELLRRPAVAVFVVALIVRMIAAVAIYIIWGGYIFGDEGTYSEMATAVVEGRTESWDDFTRGLYWRTAAWTIPLTGLYAAFTPHIFLGQLLASVFGAAAAAWTAALASKALPRRWAMSAGFFVALFPSQILWSALTLKDAAVWAAAVFGGLSLTSALVSRGQQRVAWGLGLVVSLVLMAHLRIHTFVVLTWAAAIAIGVASRTSLPKRMTAAGLLLVSVPWLFGLGPAALGFMSDQVGTVDERRVANAEGAATAIRGATGDPTLPSARSEAPATVATDDGTPTGGGDAGREDAADDLGGADLDYLPRGLVVMLLEPLPGTIAGNSRVRLAALEHLVWYPLLLLAAVGLGRAWRVRDVLAYPVLAAAAITVMYGLAEGNFGTAYRHRGEFVWAVALLAAFGAERLWRKYRRRQEESS